MPTPNPRTNVTLSPSLDSLLVQMAGLQRVSKSQVLRELLEAAEPALRRAVTVMKAAQGATSAMRQQVAAALEAEQARAEDQLAQQLAHLDRTAADLVSVAESIRVRRPARSVARLAAAPRAAASDPPSSNRGVRRGRKGGQP